MNVLVKNKYKDSFRNPYICTYVLLSFIIVWPPSKWYCSSGQDTFFFDQKMMVFYVFLPKTICCSAHWKRLIETLPMSTDNIYFHAEIRK